MLTRAHASHSTQRVVLTRKIAQNCAEQTLIQQTMTMTRETPPPRDVTNLLYDGTDFLAREAIVLL